MTNSIERSLGSRGIRMKHGFTYAAIAAALAAATACSDPLGVPNYNNPTVDGIGKDPNGVQLLATGILYNQRNQMAGFSRDLMIFGREGYNYFTTDGRTVSNYLEGIPGPQRLDPSGFANGNWNGRYQDIKNTLALINAANTSTTLTAAQKSAVEGFAKTWYALDILYLIETRDSLGVPVETTEDAANPKPFVSRDSAYKFITGMLDDAYAKLQAGGATFPFTLHSGFAGFNTPPNFAKFNRAIQARNLVERGSLGCGSACYQQALTALSNSFVTAPGAATSLDAMNVGPYHIFSTVAGDVLNANSYAQNNYIYAHASFGKDAQLQPGGLRDDRYLRKIDSLAAPVSPPGNQNIPAYHKFNVFPTNVSPAAVIRNEELILLRAEANALTGNLAAALVDINNVRTVSGKLAPLAALGANPIDNIMYERRYSLILEGHRWVDMRRWGRLGQLPIDRPGVQFVAKVMPIPQTECDGRTEKPNGCS